MGASGFTAQTNPNADKATEIIAEVEAEVECVVATRYVLPLVVAGNSLVVRSIVLALASARVRKIIDSNLPESAEQSLHARAEKDARTRLQAILDGKLQLHGEVAAVAGNGVKSYAASNNLKHTFHKGCKQW